MQTVPRWLRGVGFRESGKPLRMFASDWTAASPIISGPAFLVVLASRFGSFDEILSQRLWQANNAQMIDELTIVAVAARLDGGKRGGCGQVAGRKSS